MESDHQAFGAIQAFRGSQLLNHAGPPGPLWTTWTATDYSYKKFFAPLPGTPRDLRVMSITRDAAWPLDSCGLRSCPIYLNNYEYMSRL